MAEHTAKIGKLKQDKVEAHSREDEQLATKIRKQIDAAEAKVIDLEERQAGAQLAASRADSERTEWITGHYLDLVAALEPDAKRAAKAIDELSDQLLDAVKQWQDVSGTVARLASIAGQAGRAPSLGWDALAKELRNRPQPTPVPLPGGQFGIASVVPHDDPDPAIREPARQEIREKAKR